MQPCHIQCVERGQQEKEGCQRGGRRTFEKREGKKWRDRERKKGKGGRSRRKSMGGGGEERKGEGGAQHSRSHPS